MAKCHLFIHLTSPHLTKEAALTQTRAQQYVILNTEIFIKRNVVKLRSNLTGAQTIGPFMICSFVTDLNLKRFNFLCAFLKFAPHYLK